MATPGVYEAFAKRAYPSRWILTAAALVLAVLGLGATPVHTLLRGSAIVLWGLACCVFWFHPVGGLGPAAIRGRGMLSAGAFVISWPVAILLGLWFLLGGYRIAEAIRDMW